MRIKMLMVSVLLFTLYGCAMLPSYRETSNAKLIAENYLLAIKDRHYEESYNFLSANLRNNISLKQHVGLMRILQSEWGDIESYKMCRLPLPYTPTLLDDEIFKDPFRDDGSIFWFYELKFKKEPIMVRIDVKREDGRYKINAFGVISKRLYTDKNLRKKIEELDIPIDKNE